MRQTLCGFENERKSNLVKTFLSQPILQLQVLLGGGCESLDIHCCMGGGVGGWLHLELKGCFYFSDKQSRRARCSGQVLVPAPLLCMFSMTATLEHISCQSRDCTVFLCEPTCGSNRRESSPVRNTFHTHSFEFQPGPRRQRDSLQLYRHTDYIPD